MKERTHYQTEAIKMLLRMQDADHIKRVYRLAEYLYVREDIPDGECEDDESGDHITEKEYMEIVDALSDKLHFSMVDTGDPLQVTERLQAYVISRIAEIKDADSVGMVSSFVHGIRQKDGAVGFRK
jgi:hypothetical protein